MMTNKKIQPFLYVLQFTFTFSTRKIIIETFRSIFDVLYRSFDYAFLIWRMDVMLQSQEPASLWIPCTIHQLKQDVLHIFLEGLI